MKALSLYQPYAAGLAVGLKRNETRSWKTKHVGEIAIHATKSEPMCVFRSLEDPEFVRLREICGAIVGVCEIVECVPVEEIRDALTPREKAFGDYENGRFAWICRNARQLDTPIICGGARQLWTVPESIELQIRAQQKAQSDRMLASLEKAFPPRLVTSRNPFRRRFY